MDQKSNRIDKTGSNFYLKHKPFILIILFAITIRFFAFFVIFLGDNFRWVEMSSLLINGINPYETNIEFFYKYPPLFHFFINFFGVMSNFTYIGPKLMVFCFDILNLIIIYLMGIKLKSRVLGTNAAIFYAFNPSVILQFNNEVNEIVTLFFSLLAIYFLISNRFVFSSISLSLGIGFKLYPIFFLIPILIYIYKNSTEKKIRNIFWYCTCIIIIFIGLSLPFLLISPDIFIYRFFIHSSRLNLGDSLTEQIPAILWLYNPAFEIFGFAFSYQFLIQMIIMLALFLFFFLSKKNFNIHDLLTSIVIISFILPLINYQIQLKYSNLIAFPFLLFIIYKDMKIIKENEIYLLYLVNLFFSLLFFLLMIFIFPPIDNLISYDFLMEKGGLSILFWLISSLIFIINDYRHHKEGDYKLFILIILPFIIYNLFNNWLGAIITIFLVVVGMLYIFKSYWFKFKKNEKIFIISNY